MVLSILHRATGIVLSVGLVVLTAWLMSAAAGPAAYGQFAATMNSAAGLLLMIGWSYAFFFHLANGIRHLVWDTGRGLEMHQAISSAWFVVIVSLAVTAVFWILLP